MNYKNCTKCKIRKLLSEFYKSITHKDGLCSQCKECTKEYGKSYRIKNEETDRKRKKEWKANNREWVNTYDKKKRQKDIQYRLSSNLRSRLRGAMRQNHKSGSAVRDLGCTIYEFKKYLESKFQSGMTWGNYGIHGWHIDHIKPLCSFDLSNKSQVKEACHYSNLQPLWAKDNYAKIESDLKHVIDKVEWH